MNNELSLVFTADGSHSIWSDMFQEEYHSSKGAIMETQHTYIDMGLAHVLRKTDGEPLHIFELSLGTGLTALMSVLFKPQQVKIYHTIEPYPVSISHLKQLNYSEKLCDDEGILEQIHNANWDELVSVTPTFQLKKEKVSIHDHPLPQQEYHLIYMDAFSPQVQRDLWSPEVLSKLFLALRPGGVLVTYCAAGFVRREFGELGGVVERLNGAKGKREMLRITRPN